MGQPHLIVWDLDGTLGDFQVLERCSDDSLPVDVQVRVGMAESLKTLADAGFTHTLLTVATHTYAELVLRGTGLREFFTRIEGRGERGKGDAAGLGQVFGIPMDEWPARMVFVGDRPVFDEPEDPRVVFHLEPCGLSRPASVLTQLLLHLRDRGRGSLRQGFDALARERPWWRKLIQPRASIPLDVPLERMVPAAGPVLLMARTKGCPVIGFAHPPDPQGKALEQRFIPGEIPL